MSGLDAPLDLLGQSNLLSFLVSSVQAYRTPHSLDHKSTSGQYLWRLTRRLLLLGEFRASHQKVPLLHSVKTPVVASSKSISVTVRPPVLFVRKHILVAGIVYSVALLRCLLVLTTLPLLAIKMVFCKTCG